MSTRPEFKIVSSVALVANNLVMGNPRTSICVTGRSRGTPVVPGIRWRKAQTVTESTIIATIHWPDIRYCPFRNPLVTYIPYHVPCTFLIVIISHWVVLFLVHLSAPLAPCTQIGYSTLLTVYYWIITSVATPYLFDSITCLVSYILSAPYLCLGLSCFATLVALHFDILGQDTWLCIICI